MRDGVCPKCQSTEIIPQARVQTDQAGMGEVDNWLTVAVYENPAARLFRGKRRGTLYAWVCGACGYTELYVINRSELLAAYKKSQGL